MVHRRVLIVDDSRTVCAMIETLLDRHADIEVVGVIDKPGAAMGAIAMLEPDVLTLDLSMPGMDGLSLLRMVMRTRPMPVIVVSSATNGPESDLARAVMATGAAACFDKARLVAEARAFVTAVRTARAGRYRSPTD